MEKIFQLIGKNCLVLFVVLTCFCFSFCGNSTSEPDLIPDPDPSIPEEVIYESAPVPPTIPVVNEQGYTVYFVDSGILGNDSNDGHSEGSPFKTLEKISSLVKQPKTKVLLKSGCVFTGTLSLKDLNSSDSYPFIVDIYGGNVKPTIDGNGRTSAVEIFDDNIRFRNIRVMNKKGKRGIYVAPQMAGAFKNVEITNCRIEDVNWMGSDKIVDVNPADLDVQAICSDSNFEYTNGGIICEASTDMATGASWFENLYITNNEIFKVTRTGIWVSTMWGKRPGIGWGYNDYVDDNNGWYPAKNVVVQGNEICYTGGDCAVLIATRNSYLDHNKAFHGNYLGRSGFSNAGIWPHSSIDFVMQYNEVAYTHRQHGSGDGEGLDVDIANINCLVQYNYVHHNEGGGLLLCNAQSEINGQKRIGDHRGTIVRNNLFYDNGLQDNSAFLTVSSAVGETNVYNNTVIVTDRLASPVFIITADWGNIGKSKNFTFRNNLFYATSTVSATFDLSQVTNCLFKNNLTFGIGNMESYLHDEQSLNYDPKISIPTSFDGYENALLFKAENNQLFQDGLLFNGMLDKDMAGNSVEGQKYVGAFCK